MTSASNRRAGQFAWWHLAAAAVLFALAAALAPASVQAAETLKGVALVIGNGDYEHLSKLENPEHDANDVEELLDKLGFDTTATADRDARRLRRDLEGFAEDAKGADVAVLYYSGHGIEAGGNNFLVPVDADLSSLEDAGDNLVAVDALIEKLKAEVPIVIVMLDACRNNPFPADAVLKLSPDGEALPVAVSGLGGSRSAVSLNPTTAPEAPPQDANLGMVLAFAAEPGKVALDGEPGQNSPYAAALLRHLSAMAGDEFGMVMRMVAEEVYLKTKGQQRPWVNESMRRLLYLGQAPDQPTGAEGDILTERRGLLVTIAALPDRERRTIESVAADTGVPMDALYGMLKALGSEVPDDPGQLETLLRGQTEKVKAMIAERDTLQSTDPEILRLSELADQALAEGALNTAISLRQQAKERAREVEATVEDAEAQLRQRRIELAEVYAKSAEAYALAFKHREAASDYEEAARQVERWDDEQAFWYIRAASTAFLEAGKLRGGASDLQRSIDTGRLAVTMVDRLLADNSGNAEHWQDISAQTLNNLANASSSLFAATKDRKFLLEAIDAYERCLKVLQRERDPQSWVIVQHNLAGSLMMLGGAEKDNSNLEKAIVAYNAALEVWTRDANPERWAISMAGLGDTQDRLSRRTNDVGLLNQAIRSLESALEVQTQATTPLDWAITQRALSDAYSELARRTRDQAVLNKSMAASQEALKVYTLERTPRLWAQTMHDMAVHLVANSGEDDAKEALEKAVAIYDQIVAAMHPDEQLNEYGLSAGNAALSRVDLGRMAKDPAQIEGAIAALHDVATLYQRHGRGLEQAGHTRDIGEAYVALGKLRARPDEYQHAIDAFDSAAQLFRQAGDVESADALSSKLASAYGELGFRKFEKKDYVGAAAARRTALAHSERDKDPSSWRFAAIQLGVALQTVGEAQQGVEALRQAADAYRLALSATEIETKREEWASDQQGLVNALSKIAERSGVAADYAALAQAYAAQVDAKDNARDRDGRDTAEMNRAWALSMAGELGMDRAMVEKAVSAWRGLVEADALPASDRLFATLQLLRALFVAGNLGGGDPMYREAIALTDAHWAFLEREATTEQKVNVLLDRANLMSTVAKADPAAYSTDDIEAVYRRAIALADPVREPALWQNAQRQLALYQLDGSDRPDFPLDRFQSGLGALRTLLDATPREKEPQAWADTANWYGYALSLYGKRENAPASFDEAVPLLRQALATFEAANNPVSVAHTQDSLCGALVGLGRLQKQRALVAEGVENCDRSVAYMREHKVADVLPVAEANLADARRALAEFGPQ